MIEGREGATISDGAAPVRKWLISVEVLFVSNCSILLIGSFRMELKGFSVSLLLQLVNLLYLVEQYHFCSLDGPCCTISVSQLSLRIVSFESRRRWACGFGKEIGRIYRCLFLGFGLLFTFELLH